MSPAGWSGHHERNGDSVLPSVYRVTMSALAAASADSRGQVLGNTGRATVGGGDAPPACGASASPYGGPVQPRLRDDFQYRRSGSGGRSKRFSAFSAGCRPQGAG